ncbi:MAG: lipid A deacylase LpxR family protein [Proteobacteria bacterium]|nr:lipid A deacylase LpxR family protein [Pseudomonadota bacterium]
MKVPFAALAVLLATVGSAAAQRVPIDSTPDPDEMRGIFTIQVENDVFNRIGRSDRDYTNGIRLGWLSPALPELPTGVANLLNFPTFFGEGPVSSVTRRVGLSIGQNLYTPQDTDSSAPIFNDRPYAAWLYASVALQQIYKRNNPETGKDDPVRLDTIALDVGLVGPAAGGEFVQNNFHKLIGVETANGWANQLHNEPTFGLTFERRWRVGHGIVFDDPRLEYDVVPRIGATIGNASTYASAGGTVRIGKELRADFGPTRARPALPGSEGFIGEGFGWYVFAGLGGEAVGRNMFLSGNWDGNDIVSVTPRPFVGEASVGIAVLFRGVRISYTQVLRTPEFYERSRFDQFGSLNVTFRY